MTGLRVGFGRRDITPALGLPLGGYGARLGGAAAVLDRLFCQAAVFDDGREVIAMVALDLVHVFGNWVARVRSQIHRHLGIGADRVLVAAIHTHAGPGVFRSSIERDDRLADYEEMLIEQVATCVGVAAGAAVPAGLRFGSASAAGVAANRRDPALPVDEEVRVLSAHRPDGTLLGAVANFACHPTVLPATNHGYSGDLLGGGSQRAAEILGAPVLFLNGAAGDVSTRFTRRAQTHAEVGRLGGLLAGAVVQAIDHSTEIVGGELAAAVQSVPVRWRALPSPDAAVAQLQAAVAELERMRSGQESAGTLRLAEARVEGAQAELWASSQGGWEALFGTRPAKAEVQALRCGDMTIVAAPGELFSAAGTAVRSQLGDRAIVAGYANDYLGYFIPQADAVEGGYEALIAMVDPACEAAIRRGLLQVAASAGCARTEG